MTFEEMQRILEQMLVVQRELQGNQRELQETQQSHRREIERMLAVQRELQESQLGQQQRITQLFDHQERQQRLVDRLIGIASARRQII
jgi:hypothetical protein